MRHTAAKFVPRLLSNDQKEHRIAVCSELKENKMKLKLKGRRSESTEEIQAESQDVMKMLTQNDFQQCFRSGKSCWDRCINT
jgi:D-ribose pyranose/furanose isomerase RbsD